MKKLLLPFLLCVIALCALFYALTPSRPTMEGIYLQKGSDTHLFINEEIEFMIMSNKSGAENLFEGLQDGDHIAITYGDIREIFPLSGDVYAVKLIKQGTREDITQDLMAPLIDSGWISE